MADACMLLPISKAKPPLPSPLFWFAEVEEISSEEDEDVEDEVVHDDDDDAQSPIRITVILFSNRLDSRSRPIMPATPMVDFLN